MSNRNPDYDELLLSGLSDTELAQQLGKSRQAIAAARKVRGIAPVVTHGGKRAGAGRKPQLAQPNDKAQAPDGPK